MRVFMWGLLILGMGVLLALLVMSVRPPAAHHVERDNDRLLLVSPSGYQTVSMVDGGHTGLYYDVAEDLLRGQPRIERVVLLGLGGGEMLKGAARVQPSAALIGVEIDDVTAIIARDTFDVPGTIVVADALDWISTQPESSLDVVMVDLFDDNVMVDASTQTPFLGSCAYSLRPFGLFIMNVFPGERAPLIEARLAPFFVTARRSYGPNVVITGMRRP